MQGHGRCPERCLCAWQKVRETLKGRCKSHKVRQTHPQERYLCITPLSADGFSNNTAGLGERIQFNTKNLEEIAWEGVIKMSHTPSLISTARVVSPPPGRTQTKPASVFIPGPIQTSECLSQSPAEHGFSLGTKRCSPTRARLLQPLRSRAGATPSLEGPLSLLAQ